MPELSYDALVTLLIFLIGVPTLVLQTVDTEIRRVIVKHWGGIVRDTAVPVAVAIVVIFIGVEGEALLETIPVSHEMTLVNTENFVVSIGKGNLAFLVYIALFALATFSAARITQRYGRRESVISQLERLVASELPVRPRLISGALEDLIELGEQSEAGQDKEAVLQALFNLTNQICRHVAYQGDAFETLIPRLPGILTWNTQQANSKNFQTTAEILRAVIATQPRAPASQQADLLKAISALSTLGQAAIEHIHLASEVDAVLTVCVQALSLAADQYPETTTAVSQSLFEIGIAAIEKGHMFVAASALDKLFLMVDTNQPARGELVADALGLASHFWVAGDASKVFVEKRLDEAKSELAQKWRVALKFAQEHCLMTMQFKTADNLGEMIASR
jgi:hypothetical protein